MTRDELIERFKKHDHYYEFCDDMRNWRAGLAERNHILQNLKSIPREDAIGIIDSCAPKDLKHVWYSLLEK